MEGGKDQYEYELSAKTDILTQRQNIMTALTKFNQEKVLDSHGRKMDGAVVRI